jgi:hypothetical protein
MGGKLVAAFSCSQVGGKRRYFGMGERDNITVEVASNRGKLFMRHQLKEISFLQPLVIGNRRMAGPDGVAAIPGKMRMRTKLRIGQPLAGQTFDWIIP